MPISAAALEGISANGLAWKGKINLGGQPARLADPEKLLVGDCAKIRDEVVRRCKTFISVMGVCPLTLALNRKLDELEMVDDDPDQLRRALDELYDVFDFYRICVVG